MSLVEVLKIIVLGIVEGFTEWLPISSTGHMILVDEIIRLDQPDAFKEMFLVVIQGGSVDPVDQGGRRLCAGGSVRLPSG